MADLLIPPGCNGVEPSVTLNVCAADVPQVFDAVTEIVPAIALDVVLIVLVVEVPDHPDGNVQLYEVAPATALTE